MKDWHFKISGTISAIGIITAIVSGILYFMALPIFSETELAWIFFFGLLAAALAAFTIAATAIWTE